MSKPSIYDGMNSDQRAMTDHNIVDCYRGGMTMDQIAHEFEVSKSKVWKVLRDYGVASRQRVYVDVGVTP